MEVSRARRAFVERGGLAVCARRGFGLERLSASESSPNDDDGTGPPHVPPTLVASQRVERLSRVVVRGLWTAQQTTRPQPASRGRRTHRVRALESAERVRHVPRPAARKDVETRRAQISGAKS